MKTLSIFATTAALVLGLTSVANADPISPVSCEDSYVNLVTVASGIVGHVHIHCIEDEVQLDLAPVSPDTQAVAV